MYPAPRRGSTRLPRVTNFLNSSSIDHHSPCLGAALSARASPAALPMARRRKRSPLIERRGRARHGSRERSQEAPACAVSGRANGPSRPGPDRPRTCPADAPGAPWDRDPSAASAGRPGVGSPRDGRRTTHTRRPRRSARPREPLVPARTTHTSSRPNAAGRDTRTAPASRSRARSPSPRGRRCPRRMVAAMRAADARSHPTNGSRRCRSCSRCPAPRGVVARSSGSMERRTVPSSPASAARHRPRPNPREGAGAPQRRSRGSRCASRRSVRLPTRRRSDPLP